MRIGGGRENRPRGSRPREGEEGWREWGIERLEEAGSRVVWITLV